MKTLILLFTLAVFNAGAQNSNFRIGTAPVPILYLIKEPIKIVGSQSNSFGFTGPYNITLNGPDSLTYEGVGTVIVKMMDKKTKHYEIVAYKDEGKEWVILDSRKAIETMLYVLLMTNKPTN